MMTVREVALRLKLSAGAVYKAVAQGELEHHRFGTAIRITDDQLTEWLERTRADNSASPDESGDRGLFSTPQFKHL